MKPHFLECENAKKKKKKKKKKKRNRHCVWAPHAIGV